MLHSVRWQTGWVRKKFTQDFSLNWWRLSNTEQNYTYALKASQRF